MGEGIRPETAVGTRSNLISGCTRSGIEMAAAVDDTVDRLFFMSEDHFASRISHHDQQDGQCERANYA
jgi:hypothetical protein